MRTRTRLTTPPGQEPVEDGAGRNAGREHYVHGLALPTEPHVRGRSRRPLTFLLVVLVVAALGYGAFRITTLGQYEDPALSDLPAQETTDEGGGDPEG